MSRAKQFFSSILKQKKAAIFALLFLVVAGVATPYIAFADWNPVCWAIWGKPKPETFREGYCYFSGSNNKKVMEVVNKTVDSAVKPVFNGVVLAAGMILIIISGTLSSMAAGFLGWVMSPDFVKISYTGLDNPAVATGWPMVRDLANMLIVLGFVIVGIATTLRIQEYQAKKLLPKLIIVALLINFSLVITGIFIDASNITTKYFLQSGGFMQKSLTLAIEDQVSSLWQNYESGDTTTILGAATGFLFFNAISFVIFILFFFLFIFRYAALWILVILSPLAFVFYIFPYTKKFFDMWLNNFIQWCIIGIPASFFLWVADKITADLIVNPAGPAGGNPSLGAYLLPGVFLIAGFLFSLQTSAMGASTAIGAFKKTGKFTGGAINKSRLGDMGRGTKNLAARVGGGLLERIGVASTGTRSRITASAVDKAHKDKRMDTHTDDEILRQMNSRGATGAAAFKEATKRKILNRYAGGNMDRLAERAAHAEGWGVDRGDAENLVPELARHNARRVGEIENTMNPVTGVHYTRPEAQRQAVRERNQRQGPSKIKDMAPAQLNCNLAEDVSYSTMARARLEMTDEQKNNWRTSAVPHLEALRLAIPNMLNGAIPPVMVAPIDPTHPRHAEYIGLVRKIAELGRR